MTDAARIALDRPKRAFVIEPAGIRLELGKAVSINSNKEFIYLEKMDDGKWRLSWSIKTLPDFTGVHSLRIDRSQE